MKTDGPASASLLKANPRYYRGMAMALTTAFLWGFLPIFLKVALKDFSSQTIVGFRFLFAFVVLGVAALLAVRILTLPPVTGSEPSWSPDGATLLFSSDRDGERAIYSLRLQDRCWRRALDSSKVRSPKWRSKKTTEYLFFLVNATVKQVRFLFHDKKMRRVAPHDDRRTHWELAI